MGTTHSNSRGTLSTKPELKGGESINRYAFFLVDEDVPCVKQWITDTSGKLVSVKFDRTEAYREGSFRNRTLNREVTIIKLLVIQPDKIKVTKEGKVVFDPSLFRLNKNFRVSSKVTFVLKEFFTHLTPK